MRMSTAVTVIDLCDEDDSDSQPISLPAFTPALAAATAPSRSPKLALQAVAGSQLVRAAQVRPVPVTPASRSPLSLPQSCTGNHQPTAKNSDRPSGNSRARKIVGGQATMTLEAFRNLFPKNSQPPVTANVRVEQAYAQLSSSVLVTVSAGRHNRYSTSNLVVEGLPGTLLCGKRLVCWSLDSTPVHEPVHGRPSSKLVRLVMQVANMPEAIPFCVDVTANAQNPFHHGCKKVGSGAGHAKHNNTALASVQTTHPPRTSTAPTNAYVPAAAAASSRAHVARVPRQGTNAAGQAAARATCTAAAVVLSPTPAITSAVGAINSVTAEPAIQQLATVWRSSPSPATSETAKSKASTPQHATAAKPEAPASEPSMLDAAEPHPSLPEACKLEALTPQTFLPKASLPEAFFCEVPKHEASTPEAATSKACKQESSSPAALHKTRYKPLKPQALFLEALTPEVFRSEVSTLKNLTPEASTSEDVMLQPPTFEAPICKAAMPKATTPEGATPEAALPQAAIPSDAQLAVATTSIGPAVPAPAAMSAGTAATAISGAGTPESPVTAQAGAKVPKPLSGPGQTVKIPKKRDHIIRGRVTVPKKFVDQHYHGAVFPMDVNLCVCLNGVTDTVIYAVKVQGRKGVHRLLKAPVILLTNKKLLRFVYVSETMIELHIADVPQVAAASAQGPPVPTAAAGSSSYVVENASQSPAGSHGTKRTLHAATPRAEEVAPLAEACTGASSSNKKQRKAAQKMEEHVQALGDMQETLNAQSALVVSPPALSSPKPAKKQKLLSTADLVLHTAAALTITGSDNQAAGGVGGEMELDSKGTEPDHGATTSVAQPGAANEVPERNNLSDSEGAEQAERQNQKLERKLQRCIKRQLKTDAAVTAASEAAPRAEAEKALELEAQRLAEERAAKIRVEDKAARKLARSHKRKRVEEEAAKAAQVAEETAATTAAAAEAALLAEAERAPLPAPVKKAEKQTRVEHPSGEALSDMGMLLAQLLTVVQAPGEIRAQALTNLRLLHGADSFVTVIYPRLVAESHEGRFGVCKHHMLTWLEANSLGLPKVSKNQAMQLVPDYLPVEASEGKMAEVVTQAVSLLGMRPKVMRNTILRAQAALARLRGHDHVFAHSAGHAFLCEAVSRQNAGDLPHILNQLLNMQLPLVPHIS